MRRHNDLSRGRPTPLTNSLTKSIMHYCLSKSAFKARQNRAELLVLGDRCVGHTLLVQVEDNGG